MYPSADTAIASVSSSSKVSWVPSSNCDFQPLFVLVWRSQNRMFSWGASWSIRRSPLGVSRRVGFAGAFEPSHLLGGTMASAA